jgi:cullin 3
MNDRFTRGYKGVSEENVEQNQKDILKIFCCFYGRDLFIKHYTKLLSTRLMNRTSVNDNAEQVMIKFLQVECGHNFVSKMKTMFTDMD